jgi:hypothetical protein
MLIFEKERKGENLNRPIPFPSLFPLQVAALIREKGIKPHNVWNFDETAIVQGKNSKVRRKEGR